LDKICPAPGAVNEPDRYGGRGCAWPWSSITAIRSHLLRRVVPLCHSGDGSILVNELGSKSLVQASGEHCRGTEWERTV
jgi:hypothetical protein